MIIIGKAINKVNCYFFEKGMVEDDLYSLLLMDS